MAEVVPVDVVLEVVNGVPGASASLEDGHITVEFGGNIRSYGVPPDGLIFHSIVAKIAATTGINPPKFFRHPKTREANRPK